MKSLIYGLSATLLLLASFMACESTSTSTDPSADSTELQQIEALFEAAKNTVDDTVADSAEWTPGPCFDADSALVRAEARMALQKMEMELVQLASSTWPENPVFQRLEERSARQSQRSARLIERLGVAPEVLQLPVGQFNDAELDALYASLATQIEGSETDAVVAMGYLQEFLITQQVAQRGARRASAEAAIQRLQAGTATACDSAQVAAMRQNRDRANAFNGQRPTEGVQQARRIGAPMVLRYIVRFLEQNGITYEAQLIDEALFESIMTQAIQQNGQNGRPDHAGQGSGSGNGSSGQ